MIPYTPKRPQATFPHPGNDIIEPGEITITVERPSPRDRELYAAALAPYEQPVLAKDERGRPYLNAAGKAIPVAVDPKYPLRPMIEFLTNLSVNIQGLCDPETKAPIPFRKDEAEAMLWFLSDNHFAVPKTAQFPKLDDKGDELKGPDGNVVMQEIQFQLAYPVYVIEQIVAGGAFGDPLGRPARTPSSESSSAS